MINNNHKYHKLLPQAYIFAHAQLPILEIVWNTCEN